MPMIKHAAALIVLLSLTLGACAGSSFSNSPATVFPGDSIVEERQFEGQDIPLAPTQIPPPSPTPLPTPLPTQAPKLSTPSTPPLSMSRPQAEVIIAVLNIRRGPGVNYPIIAVAHAGDVFEVIGTNSLGDWLQIINSDGTPGWISGQIPYTRLLAAEVDDLPLVQSPSLASSEPTISEVVSSSGSYDELKGRLIFMTRSGGDLYRVNADGRNLHRLARGIIDPVVSPDGQQVAFTRWDGAEFGTLYTINIDGTGERAIAGDIRPAKVTHLVTGWTADCYLISAWRATRSKRDLQKL